ncbi:MAG: hypothetical protein IJH84_17240 [Saccharopolyspora sp.]|uniref:hypothetical protein n=1 Tax=Saccharopolyspora TaxID=1835 RepID=UPI00190B3B5A|nr:MULTISPECIES: hypothetical protein [unclassified Saccharopolyspora]MBK0868137.1 hypothetical protein [Saccharopolyspora sp. HNM0986]MBQ6642761.1 hypothetical protein [Saccharopolyspora sp.]
MNTIMIFAAGFLLASLIFWPMLARARRTDADSAPTGKHAMRPAPREQAHSAQAGEAAGGDGKPAAESGETAPAREETAENTSEAAEAAPHRPETEQPQPDQQPQRESGEPVRSAEVIRIRPSDQEIGVSVGTLPTSLFEEHHAAKFRRTQDRIERLRSQLHERN